MTYTEVSKLAEQLGYRDKLRLAQLLIQLARKEEEEQYPTQRTDAAAAGPPDAELVRYVSERLKKLKPSRKEAVLNSIGAMFQFQGGISDEAKEALFAELVKRGHIVTGPQGRIQYPDAAAA